MYSSEFNSRYHFYETGKVSEAWGPPQFQEKTLSEWKRHSRSSQRVPGYSRSSSWNSKFHSQNTKFHSRNGISRLEQYENHNSRSNSRSDSRNWWEPTWKISFAPPFSEFFSRIGVVPARENDFVFEIDAFAPWNRGACRVDCSRDFCNCNCNQARKTICRIIFHVCKAFVDDGARQIHQS